MSYTNAFYDDTRVKQYMDENTYIGQYRFHVPGNGRTPCYVEDPHVRLTKWGANRWTNNLYIEEQFTNRSRRHKRLRHNYTLDDLRENIEGNSQREVYPDCGSETGSETGFETKQSRASHPAWTYRDLEVPQFNERHFPLRDPFHHLSLQPPPKPAWTRLEFKDAARPPQMSREPR